jgi:hypothetical protein
MKKINFIILLLTLAMIGCAKGERGSDGRNGVHGADGASPEVPDYSIVGVIDPCGDEPSVIDEILLVLKNGQIVTYFAESGSAQKARLVLIPDGTYVTTDTTNCVFTIQAGQVYY